MATTLRSNYCLLRKLSARRRAVSSGAPCEPTRSFASAMGLLPCRRHASTNLPQQPSPGFAAVQEDLEGPAGPSGRIIFEKAAESLPAKSKEKVHLLPQNLPSRPAKVVKKVDDNSLRHNSLLLKPASLQRGDRCIPMKAFYISRSVDLKALKDEALIETMSYTRTTLVAGCKYCTVGPPYLPQRVGTPWMSGPFLVVFHYVSAVLVNFMLQDEEDLYLNLVKKHCVESLDHTEEARKDDYKIVIRPSLETWSQAGFDTIFLQKLDMDNIRVVTFLHRVWLWNIISKRRMEWSTYSASLTVEWKKQETLQCLGKNSFSLWPLPTLPWLILFSGFVCWIGQSLLGKIHVMDVSGSIYKKSLKCLTGLRI